MNFLYSSITLLSFFFVYFPHIAQPDFGAQVNLGKIENDDIVEASGLVASRNNKGVLWTHNDSGNENRIFAIDTAGNSLATYYIKDIENRDWEDITIGPGPNESQSYLYIGDMGDNDSKYDTKFIYRILEPSVSVGQTNIIDTVQQVYTITFSYPDGNRDAEILMHDPITKSIYILGKRDSNIRVYKLPYPQSTSTNIEAELAIKFSMEQDPEDETPNNYLTAGDISFDGNEIIIKSYTNVFYWERENGLSIEQTLEEVPKILPYEIEPQGEAICWNPFFDKGYFTLSEEDITYNGIPLTFPAELFYYPRTTPVKVNNEFLNSTGFQLEQNYPNPFNPTTTIKYSIPNVASSFSSSNVTIKIYDILGNELSTLVNEIQASGNYEFIFHSKDYSSGVYYYHLQMGDYGQTRKMVILK